MPYYGGPELIGPMVYTKTYIFTCFYSQYFVLFTMVPRNSLVLKVVVGRLYTRIRGCFYWAYRFFPDCFQVLDAWYRLRTECFGRVGTEQIPSGTLWKR